MPRPTMRLFPAVLLALLWPGHACAQDRRGTLVPGLVLDAGGRHGACDVLLFTPDGKHLLAAGDDKVVRTWAVAADGTLGPAGAPLRWPIYREQRGSIFAAALSPDANRIAVAGFGVYTGMAAVIDRGTGEIAHAMTKPLSAQVTWAVAYAPSGKYVVLGDRDGQLFRWQLGQTGEPTPFAGSAKVVDGKKVINRTRLITFLSDTRFLAVCQDGVLREWDVTRPGDRPTVLGGGFEKKALLRVTISGTATSKQRWLAGLGDNVGGGGSRSVELLDLTKIKAGGKAARDYRRSVTLPRAAAGRDEYPTALAFDAAAKRLAVGTFVEVSEAKVENKYVRPVGGNVRVWDMAGQKWDGTPLDIGYRTDSIAWRPGAANQLATAGGPNHEVRTWTVGKAKPVSEVRTPGSGLWAVAFDAKDRYIAWRDRLNTTAPTANNRGAGPWRVFDLKAKKILPAPPKDFSPVKPVEQEGGWRVEATANGYLWNVVSPKGNRTPLDAKSGLYDAATNQIPRCYTFLPSVKGKPVRLVVGHMWGLSVYEMDDKGVRLARLLTGHEGEVMAVAPSRDGQLLLTASRDQTLCCWSLVDWPQAREFGVSFRQAGGRAFVQKVDPGSPGWETGMTEGDELVALVSVNPRTGKVSVYNPERIDLAGKYRLTVKPANDLDAPRAVALLKNAEPGREYVVLYRDNDAKGKPPVINKLTTVRQRPLWRFFPTRADAGNDWVIWRWRDFFYDTGSTRGDQLLGWHVNRVGFASKPRFHRLDELRGSDTRAGAKAAAPRGYHRPEKVWPTVLTALQQPEKVAFEQIEPPEVRVTVTTAPGKAADLVLNVVARGHNAGENLQEITRVLVWLDDHLYGQRPVIVKGAVNGAFTVPRGELRRGTNAVTVIAYNAAGGRGSATVPVEYNDGSAVVRNLHALCVGVSDYSNAKHNGQAPDDLTWAAKDATDIAAVLKQHDKSDLYAKADVRPLINEQATAARIEKELVDAAKRVGKDDLFVLFLAGHGEAQENKDGTYAAGSYFFVCTDSDTSKPATCLTSQRLYALLAAIRCRKLVILDSCHSGAVGSNPLRDLMRDNVPFIVLSACEPHQLAAEPRPGFAEKNGFFTLCLLEALGEATVSRGKKRSRAVTPIQLREAVARRLPQLLKDWNVPAEKRQTPVYIPDPLPTVRVLARP